MKNLLIKWCFFRFNACHTVSHSVDSESLAQVSRFLDQLDHVHLLFEENSEEVSIISAAAKQLTKGAFVLLTGHKSR